MEVKGVKLKVLGRGAYGVVHLVETTSPCSGLFAVKSAPLTKSFSLSKEWEIFKKFIGCPNIVQCFGGFTSFERDGGYFYNLFLEYASGGSLLDLMNKYGGKIPECDVKDYARMILEGLVDIHNRGYIHSDLKPENILVFPSQTGSDLNTLKIADFGLARQCGEKDIPQLWEYGFRGTADYMSPESVMGEISGPLDVWSLGCIIVEMISGKMPWNYSNLKDLRNKLLNGESPKIPENMSSIGKDFLAKCFARDPKQRWMANMLLSHSFLMPEFSFFSYGSNLPQLFSALSSTIFDEDKSLIQSTKSFQKDDKFGPEGDLVENLRLQVMKMGV
ncbi:mitogen-activated protein kinase kinase kinase 17-like [Durio zibethinus]|uniref:Mitogen-activated protein kinase kinase kinase 17-like n=1 Tax=Durio zibethinus TaxID=66656 RepID=A0A6P6AXK9_DURZI|nr:mitogen-activated protein kinase kinase kinase 17-like [Durio zibethinus]